MTPPNPTRLLPEVAKIRKSRAPTHKSLKGFPSTPWGIAPRQKKGATIEMATPHTMKHYILNKNYFQFYLYSLSYMMLKLYNYFNSNKYS